MSAYSLILAIGGFLTSASIATAAPQDRTLNRAEIIRLRKELIATAQRPSIVADQPYALQRFARIRELIRSEILTVLNSGVQEPVELIHVLESVLQDDAKLPVSFLRKRLNGADNVVVGFTIHYGGRALPNSRVFIEAFRNETNRYDSVAQTGEAMDDSLVKLDELPSPWPGVELWFLAHGQETIKMQYHEKMRIYSFDGYKFEEKWSSGAKKAPTFKIGRDSLEVTYQQERGPSMVQKILITTAGALESISLPKE